jgi:hypothetical protein
MAFELAREEGQRCDLDRSYLQRRQADLSSWGDMHCVEILANNLNLTIVTVVLSSAEILIDISYPDSTPEAMNPSRTIMMVNHRIGSSGVHFSAVVPQPKSSWTDCMRSLKSLLGNMAMTVTSIRFPWYQHHYFSKTNDFQASSPRRQQKFSEKGGAYMAGKQKEKAGAEKKKIHQSSTT